MLIAASPGTSSATRSSPFSISTVAGVRNGALLTRAARQFDAFVTVDRNLAFQQRIDALPFGVVVLRARSNRLSDLKPLVPALLQALQNLRPGEVKWVEA